MKKKLKYLMLASLLMPLCSVKAASGTIDIYSSSKSLNPGNTFTVTVYCKSSVKIGGCEYTLSYDSSKVKFVSTDEGECNDTYCVYAPFTTSSSKKFTFKAIATGTATISAKAVGIYDTEEKTMSSSVDPVTLTISNPEPSKPVTYSTNNNLKSLEVKGYKLDKDFKKDETNYVVNVGSEVEKIEITATKEDSTAKVSGTGTFDVSEGSNKFDVVVTSEKGTKKTYTITVNVNDKNPLEVKVNDETMTIVKRKSSIKAPENYQETTVSIDGKEVIAYTNDITNYTLVGLKDNTSKISLYIYDKNLNTFTKYNEVSLNNFKISVLDNKKEDFTKDLEQEEISINDVTIKAYKLNTNYYLMYGKNVTNGQDNWYTYEKTENTIQKYNKNLFAKQQEDLENANKLVLGLGTSTLALAILLIIVALSKGKTKITKVKKTDVSKYFLEDDQQEEKETVKEEVTETKDNEEQQEPPKDVIPDEEYNKEVIELEQEIKNNLKEIPKSEEIVIKKPKKKKKSKKEKNFLDE